MNRREMLAAGASFAFIPPALPAPTHEPEIWRAISDYYDPLAAMRDISGKFRIERRGRVTEVEYGAPDFANNFRFTEDTRFCCASVTKSITATILLKLQEQGALSLSDSVRTHLPNYRHGRRMTLDHVLRHTSGLPRNIPDEERAAGLGEGGVIGWLNAHPPTSAPGAQEGYSNLGYEVLALVAERASGKPYAELAQTLIFTPLNMQRSRIEPMTVGFRTALPHVPGPPPTEIAQQVGEAQPIGASGLAASIEDLIIWARAVRDGTIVQLKQADGKYIGSVLSFEEAGRTAIFLQGTVRGSGAGVAVFPGEDVAVAYTLNLESYPQHNAQRVLTKIAFGIDPGVAELRPPAVTLTDAHRALAGTYESNTFGRLRFYETPGPRPTMRIGMGLVDAYATPVSDGRLNWRVFNFTFAAQRDASGAITGLNVEQTMFGPEANTMTKVAD